MVKTGNRYVMQGSDSLAYPTQVPDVGNVHERSAAIFTVYIAQYSPAVTHGQEDNVTVRVPVLGLRASGRGKGLFVSGEGGGSLAR